MLTCGLLLAGATLLGERSPPPALGPAVVVHAAGPSTPPSPAPAAPPAGWACRELVVERARADRELDAAPAATEAEPGARR